MDYIILRKQKKLKNVRSSKPNLHLSTQVSEHFISSQKLKLSNKLQTLDYVKKELKYVDDEINCFNFRKYLLSQRMIRLKPGESPDKINEESSLIDREILPFQERKSYFLEAIEAMETECDEIKSHIPKDTSENDRIVQHFIEKGEPINQDFLEEHADEFSEEALKALAISGIQDGPVPGHPKSSPHSALEPVIHTQLVNFWDFFSNLLIFSCTIVRFGLMLFFLYKWFVLMEPFFSALYYRSKIFFRKFFKR